MCRLEHNYNIGFCFQMLLY